MNDGRWPGDSGKRRILRNASNLEEDAGESNPQAVGCWSSNPETGADGIPGKACEKPGRTGNLRLQETHTKWNTVLTA